MSPTHSAILPPTLSGYRRLVSRPWTADLHLTRAAIARCPYGVALESGPGFGELGRYSIFAAVPRVVFSANGAQWRLAGSWPTGAMPRSKASVLGAIRALLRTTTAGCPDDLPFAGGWIGYFGYDVATLLERLPRQFPAAGGLPDVHLGYYDTFIVMDRQTGAAYACAVDTFAAGRHELESRLDSLERTLEGAVVAVDSGAPLIAGEPVSNFSKSEYCAAVERTLEYIRAGDIFQANLSQQFSAIFVGSVEQLADRCARWNPAPFSAVVRGGDWSVVSTSPERFFLMTPDGRVETRPIKGTRPRGETKLEDDRLREELRHSPKDRAELTMIVDLERNDLGRVCDFGSVRVAEHAEVESYANVHHLVSTVDGRLHPRYDVVDLMKAMFPGGSITGAPKIRAMQIIDELERCRRSVYTGAIGYFSDHGRADWNIAIRTIVADGQRLHYHVGGGIVADSDPEAEYRETLAKGRRIRQILLGESPPADKA